MEICICAAVRMDDGTVLRGHRHDDCFKTAIKYGFKERITLAKQGFVTSEGRFVDRREGMQLEKNAARPLTGSMKHLNGDMLFSEHLY